MIIIYLLCLGVLQANADFIVKTNMKCTNAGDASSFITALELFDVDTTYTAACDQGYFKFTVDGPSAAVYIVSILNWDLDVNVDGMRLDQRTITHIDGILLHSIRRRTVLITRDVTTGMLYLAILYHLGWIIAVAASVHIGPTKFTELPTASQYKPDTENRYIDNGNNRKLI